MKGQTIAAHGTPAPAEEAAAAGIPAVAPAGDDQVPGLSPAECGAKLAELFPALFVPPDAPGPVKPIKLRIHADIQSRAPGVFGRRVLGVFFSRYTTSNAYLKALAAPGAQRFDLDGQPAGEIAEEHRAAAAEELARRHAIAAERRAALRKAAAPAAHEPGRADAGAEHRPTAPRRPRPEKHERLDRPRHEGERRTGGKPPRRDDGPRHAPAPSRPPREAPPRQHARPMPDDAAPVAMPADPAQRERALLLRTFETSTLSKANFCALKRMTEAELEAVLALARQERQARTLGPRPS